MEIANKNKGIAKEIVHMFVKEMRELRPKKKTFPNIPPPSP